MTKVSFSSGRCFTDKWSSAQHTEVVWMNSDKCRSECEGRSDRKGDEKRISSALIITEHLNVTTNAKINCFLADRSVQLTYSFIKSSEHNEDWLCFTLGMRAEDPRHSTRSLIRQLSVKKNLAARRHVPWINHQLRSFKPRTQSSV